MKDKSKLQKMKYMLCKKKSYKSPNIVVCLEVENIDIMKKCILKEITYFRCCSHKLHNSPDYLLVGELEILIPIRSMVKLRSFKIIV